MTPEDNVTVHVTEWIAAKMAGEGEKKPCGDAGMRLGEKKYMSVQHDEETHVHQFSCMGGGAAICNINGASIIAIFDKNVTSSDGAAQSISRCAEQVAVMGAYL